MIKVVFKCLIQFLSADPNGLDIVFVLIFVLNLVQNDFNSSNSKFFTSNEKLILQTQKWKRKKLSSLYLHNCPYE